MLQSVDSASCSNSASVVDFNWFQCIGMILLEVSIRILREAFYGGSMPLDSPMIDCMVRVVRPTTMLPASIER